MAIFPFGTASFALFGAEVQVVSATKRRSFSELPATERRQVRRPFVTKFAVSSPFSARGFSYRLYARRGLFRGPCRFAALPRKSPQAPASPLCPGEVQRFAVRKSLAALHRFAAKKSTEPPGFPLRRGELSQFALVKFPFFRTFALRRGEGEGGDPISGGLRLRTAAQVQKIVRKKEMIFGVKSAFPKMTERIDSIGLSGAFEN